MIRILLASAALLAGMVVPAAAQDEAKAAAPRLTTDEMARQVSNTTQVYLMSDVDGDGIVTLEEQLFHPDWGLATHDPENDSLIKAFTASYLADDLDGDGVVSAEEFSASMLDTSRNDFRALDVDGNGEISFQEAIHPKPDALGALSGRVGGTSFRYGATNEEVDSPHPYLNREPYSANYAAYLGHAFARWDIDESFTLSFAEMVGVAEGESGS